MGDALTNRFLQNVGYLSRRGPIDCRAAISFEITVPRTRYDWISEVQKGVGHLFRTAIARNGLYTVLAVVVFREADTSLSLCLSHPVTKP